MNGMQQWGGYGGQQLAPQGLLGGLLGGPLGGLIGKGIGGLFGNSGLGGQIGQMAGGIGGGLLPFQADPMQQIQQAYAQQQQMQQLAPQGFFGNLLGQIGQPLGGAIGGIFGQSGLGSSIGSAAGQLGRLLPFQMDPMQQAYAQQAYGQQLAPQGFFGNLLGQIGQPFISSTLGHSGFGNTIANMAGQLGKMLPFQADPMQQAYGQQQIPQQLQQQLQQLQQLQQMQQLAPQGFFGNLLGQIGQPLGSAIGGIFGQSGLGGTIGGAAGQLGRMLPFQMDPMQQAILQQLAQQQQQQSYQGGGQQAYSGAQPTLH